MDNQNKDRMVINMQKTYHSTTNEPELVKEYNCTLPAEELLEAVMFELYDGLQAMGYESENIAHIMHKCAWQREPEIFSEEEKQEEEAPKEIEEFNEKLENDKDFALYWSEEEKQEEEAPKEIKEAFKKFYDKWLDSNSLDDYMTIDEFNEKIKNDKNFALYWRNQIV